MRIRVSHWLYGITFLCTSIIGISSYFSRMQMSVRLSNDVVDVYAHRGWIGIDNLTVVRGDEEKLNAYRQAVVDAMNQQIEGNRVYHNHLAEVLQAAREGRSPSRLIPSKTSARFPAQPLVRPYVNHRFHFLAPIAILGFLVFVSARKRHCEMTNLGTCKRCSYDLRATTERCPECGLYVPQEERGSEERGSGTHNAIT